MTNHQKMPWVNVSLHWIGIPTALFVTLHVFHYCLLGDQIYDPEQCISKKY
jgi:hypothetical protein